MDDLSKILESSFAKAGAREDAHWETLTAARGEIASRANVPAVTARKWMSILESGSETISAPSNQKIIEKITKWAGPESTAQWLDAYRDFEEASRRTHRVGLELADHAGIDARLDLEGLRNEGALRQRLVSIAARVNPTLDVHLPKEIFAEGPGLVASGLKSTDRAEVAGMYEPLKHLATISVSPRFDREDTAWHEAWHSIEPVLSETEAKALQKAFPSNQHMTSPERVAVAFARWAKLRDRLPAPPSSSLSARSIASKLRSSLLPAGQDAVNAIFEKGYDGTLGKRMALMMKDTYPAFLQKTQAPSKAAKTSAGEAAPQAKRKSRRIRV
ncbi:hypothetical protein [uncultured Sneathiella sp.]|jgi:hypothetical protein|uniref:hypothetical protein n=1 Tax=uncultured Sneathiella sp. TaxID=879315 RepID=UPI0030EC7686|tara:strand:+ start:83641 stop:84630 length:990 start_codon:yes stop_codon:yes gene_type:complete